MPREKKTTSPSKIGWDFVAVGNFAAILFFVFRMGKLKAQKIPTIFPLTANILAYLRRARKVTSEVVANSNLDFFQKSRI